MNADLRTQVGVPDALFSADFIESFGDQLLLHHGTHAEPLNKKTFEYVFRNAAEASGHSAEVNEQTTEPGADVTVDETRFSLKTEAARGQSARAANIQKLMEARWIRDVQSPTELAAKASSLIPAHLEQYERITLLRGLAGADFVRYSLFEIPKDRLMLIKGLTAKDFSEKNKYGGASADVFDAGVRVFRLRLDGSVEKVRIFNLRLDQCIMRAEWQVPVEPRRASLSGDET